MALINSYHNCETYYQGCTVLRATWDDEQLPFGPGFSDDMFRKACIHIFRLLFVAIRDDEKHLGDELWRLRFGN